MRNKKKPDKKVKQKQQTETQVKTKTTEEISKTQINLKTREILLRLRFLLTGLLFIIVGAIVVFTSLHPSGISQLPANSILIFGAGLAFDILAVVILGIYSIFFARKEGLKSAKTLDYEKDNKMLQHISPDTLKRQSLLFHIPLYIFIIFVAIVILKYYIFTNNGGFIFPLVSGMGFIAIFGFQNIYMAVTGQFYLLPDFQPEERKAEIKE